MTRLARFTNNATSRLAANLSAAGLTLTVTPGDGAKFPSLTGGQYFMVTLVKADGTKEAVKVTARATDTLTIVRAAEAVGGVQTAFSFLAGDKVELRLTAGALSAELDRLDLAALTRAATKSANYAVLEADISTLLRVDTSGGARTITLPAISSLTDAFEIVVTKVTGDVNLVNVAVTGGDTINGGSSYSLSSAYQSAWVIADRSTNTWTAINSGTGGATPVVDAFVGAGTAGPFTLSGDPVSKNNTAVYVGGVYQQKASYTLTAGAVTLGGTVTAGVAVEVLWSRPVALGSTSDDLVVTAAAPGGLWTTVRGFISWMYARYAELIGAFGSSLIGHTPAGTGAVATNVQAKLRETVSVLGFGADPTGVADSAAAFQAAVNHVQAVGATDPYDPTYSGGAALGKLVIPAGVYKISTAINVTKPCIIEGDGIRRTVIRLATANTAMFAFNIGPTVTGQNLIGGSLGRMSVICNAGAAVANGIYLSTAAPPSSLTLFVLHDLAIYNVRKGVAGTGTTYMNTIRNVTVSGTFGGGVLEYGFYFTSPYEIIYNSFTDIEVTSCGDGAYSYWFQVLACQFRNLTADAPAYFSNPYGAVKGFTIEGLNAATMPVATAITLNQCEALEDVALINCPTSKTNIGISVLGRCHIRNVRWPDSGAGNQPATPLYLQPGSKGTVTGWQVARAVTNKVDVGTAAADMNNWVFTASGDITDYDLTYKVGTFTPGYSGWAVNPTLIAANYTRIGRSVMVDLYFQDGTPNAGASISGLPFTAGATQASAAYGGCSDTSKRIAGSVLPSTSAISNIPANTLAGTFWQISARFNI